MKLKLIAGLATALMLGVSAIGHAEPICWVANGHYYEAVAFPSGITWDEARAVAANSTYLGVSGHLATITSMEENTFIVNNLGGDTFFLGGYQPVGSSEPGGNWQWITGETWSFSNWLSGEPNNAYTGGAIIDPPGGEVSEEALHFFRGGGGWNDVPRTSSWGGLIVEYEPANGQIPGPVQWLANGHYYEAVAFPLGITWDEARIYAANLTYLGRPGHLATITSMEENTFIVGVLGGASVLNGYFLGGFQPAGSTEPDGNWQWITGETWSFSNWTPGEPINAYSGGAITDPPGGSTFEEVLHLWSNNGSWNDVPQTSGWGGLIVEYEPADGLTPLPTYHLSASVTGNGSISLSPNLDSYISGTSVRATTHASTGWRFVRWEGDVISTFGVITISMTSNKTIRAVFEENLSEYTLDIVIEGLGTVSTDPTNEESTYTEDTILQVTAQPSQGYEFVRWEGNVADTSSSTTTVTMDQAQSIKAVFQKANSGGGGGGGGCFMETTSYNASSNGMPLILFIGMVLLWITRFIKNHLNV